MSQLIRQRHSYDRKQSRGLSSASYKLCSLSLFFFFFKSLLNYMCQVPFAGEGRDKVRHDFWLRLEPSEGDTR